MPMPLGLPLTQIQWPMVLVTLDMRVIQAECALELVSGLLQLFKCVKEFLALL
jgi:hypothetical protein